MDGLDIVPEGYYVSRNSHDVKLVVGVYDHRGT